MTQRTNQASFRFAGYLINKAQIEIEQEKQISKKISFGFHPKGELSLEEKRYRLTLGVVISDENKALSVAVQCVGNFEFEESQVDEKLKSYLYLNAPAIVFPYLRAYISSLTALAGINAVVLPTVNLSGLADELRKNTAIL